MRSNQNVGATLGCALVIALGAIAPACGSSNGGGSNNASDGGSSGGSGSGGTSGSGSGSGGASGSGSGSGGTSGSGGGSGSGSGSGSSSGGDAGGSLSQAGDGGTCTGGGGTPGGGGATGGPADLFPCDSVWYEDVTSAAVASDSASILTGIGEWGGGAMQIDFSIIFQHATSSTPLVTFDIDDTDDSDTAQVPVPTGGALEGETGYTCTQGGDCHLIVVDDSNQKLYELWSVSSISGTSGKAEQETIWDLTKHYPAAGRGPGCSSADAAGLAIMPGLIGLRETKAGLIKHALRFILPNEKIRKGNNGAWTAPASHGTSSTSSTTGPAYGMRLRLKSTFDASTIKSAGGKAVVQALKTYGMLLADGGDDIFTAESDYLESKADSTMTWGGTLGANDLASIQPTDFDVLDYTSPLGTGDDCKPNSFF